MNIGWIHSAGKSLLPFGNALMLRLMIEHWRQGGFFGRWIGSLAPKLAEIYIDRRTYGAQIDQAIAEGVSEIFLDFNSYGEDPSGLEAMVESVVNQVGDRSASVTMICGGVNEPTEHMSLSQYDDWMRRVKAGRDRSRHKARALVSAGLESAANQDFYRHIFSSLKDVVEVFDFHTSNPGSISDTRWILNSVPAGKGIINSEHYLYNLAKQKGYDDSSVASLYMQHLRLLEESPRLRSVYLLFPSAWQDSEKWRWLGLRLMNSELTITKVTKTWQALETWTRPPEIPPDVPPVYVDPEGRPEFVPMTDWERVVAWSAFYQIDPYLIAAIGKHETQWGRAGMGKRGWYLGYGCPRAGFCYEKYKGLENQLRYAGNQIRRDFVFPVTRESIINFGVKSWRPANPYSWGEGVWRVYKAMGRDWIPPAPGTPKPPGPGWLGKLAILSFFNLFEKKEA